MNSLMEISYVASCHSSIKLMIAFRVYPSETTPPPIWLWDRFGSIQTLPYFIPSCPPIYTPKYGIRCTPNHGRSRSTPSPRFEISRKITGFMFGNFKEGRFGFESPCFVGSRQVSLLYVRGVELMIVNWSLPYTASTGRD
jgi:hypothetical protein